MNKNVTPLNEKGKPHGYWEYYYFNGNKVGYWEWFNFDGSPWFKIYYI